MTTQLTLLPSRTGWKLDERTRAVGRRGVADARSVLQAARRRVDTTDDVGAAPAVAGDDVRAA